MNRNYHCAVCGCCEAKGIESSFCRDLLCFEYNGVEDEIPDKLGVLLVEIIKAIHYEQRDPR